MRLQRIVIGIDFSEPSIAAAKWTIHRFAPRAEVILVHAIEIPEPPSFLRERLPGKDAIADAVREGAEERLLAMAAALGSSRVSFRLGVGDAVDELTRAAHELDADLIAVGTHGERPTRWPHLGSTAELLISASSIPVLLATGMRDETPQRIVAAVDDDAVSYWVLQWARELSERFAASVTALHVVSARVLSHVLSMALVGSSGAEIGGTQLHEEFRSDTRRWLQKLVGAGMKPARAGSEIAFGHPSHEILAAADRLQSDLIVLGSRRPGRLRRAMVGSVASSVVRNASRPVLVVKEPLDDLDGPVDELESAEAERETDPWDAVDPFYTSPRA